MTNFERIEGFTFEEMAAFLRETADAGGSNIVDEACRFCASEHDGCLIREASRCLLSGTSVFKYWLYMSPKES